MPLQVSRSVRQPTPAGTYAGRCIDVYHAGYWPNMNQIPTPKCKIVFYLGQDDATGRHLYIDAFETLSLGKKANLTKLIQAWIGRPLTAEEVKDFDLEKLLGATALIQVVDKPKTDGTENTVIGSVMRLPKGMTAPASAPADYVMDRDRDEPMALRYPPPANLGGPAPAKPQGDKALFGDEPDGTGPTLDDVKKALDLGDEPDDGLPF